MMRHLGVRFSVFLLAAAAWAQETTGSIVGVIKDSSGSVIAGAQVIAARTDTGVESRTTTDDQGGYQFPLMRAGQYRVTVEATGFQKMIRENVVVNTTERVRLDIAMTVGQLSETISVTAETPLLQSEKATVGQVVEQRTIQSIPLATRNFTQILGTSAGVIGAIFNADNPGTGSDSVSVNGARRGSNNLLVDGVPTTNPLNNAPDGDGTPSIEFLGEFKVLTSLYSAEYGRNLGSVINVTTRSGTNAFHASAYEFLRNTSLNARPFFNPRRGQNNQNQFGANASGRIFRDRTFFFGGWESSRQLNANSTAAAITRVVPNVDQRVGNFGAKRIVDPTTGNQFPNNVIPASRINSTSKNIMEQFIPTPNFVSGGAINFFAAQSIATNIDQYTVRIDHRINDKANIFGRWFESFQKDLSPFGAGLPGFGQTANREKHSGSVTYNHVFSGSHVLEARFGIDLTDQFISFKNDVDPASVGLRPLGVTLKQGIPRINIINYTEFGNANNWTDLIDRYTSGATMTWIRSKHNIRYGTENMLSILNPQNAQESRGLWRYDGSATGDEFADFLLSQPRLKTFAAGPGAMTMKESTWAFFINDDFKVTQNLTINAGIRYEMHFHPAGTDIDFVSFYPERYRGVGSLESAGMVQARKNGITPTTIEGDWNNFAPRVGLAWRPTNNWVIRTGAGLFFDQRTGQTAQAFFGNPPVFTRVTQDCRVAGSGCTLTTPDNWTFVDPGHDSNRIPFPTRTTDAFVIQAIEKNTKTDNAYQWNLSVQRQLPGNVLLESAYVATKGTHLIARRNLNPLIPQGGALVRQFPGFGDIFATGQNGSSSFHSFQFTARKRVGTANIQAAYTMGKTIGNGDDGARFQTNIFRTPWNDFSRARGPANFDRRHRLALTFVQDLPFKFNSAAGKFFLNNWSINGFMVTQTGTPITVINNESGLDLGGIATDPAGAFFSDVVAGAPLTYTSGSLRQNLRSFINPAAWSRAPRSRYGTSGRGMFYGPGQTSVDFSIFKDFKVRERFVTQFRTEFFNLLNMPNFSNPASTMNAANFGQIVSTSVNARLVQFALKLSF